MNTDISLKETVIISVCLLLLNRRQLKYVRVLEFWGELERAILATCMAGADKWKKGGGVT